VVSETDETEEPQRVPGQPMTMIDSRSIPALTASQMREVDRIMAEDLHIELVQMMENAGRCLAELALRRFRPATVTVLAGPGGNGGGGLAAARHLANRGAGVQVTLSHTGSDLGAVPAHQFDIVTRMGIPVSAEPQPAALIVDALIGYGLRGDPGGRTAELIDWANAQAAVVALDNPSGLDVTTGRAGVPCVWATATLTLALPKTGLADASQTGELFLADISVPPAVYRRLGLTVPPLFRRDTIIELTVPPLSPPGIFTGSIKPGQATYGNPS
jgi:NAD(P)H-hydrate epimerase